MQLTTLYMTRNDCYNLNRKILPKGVMVHSTASPGVMAQAWFSRWNKSYAKGEINRQVCVHAFVDDKEAYQYLPWNHRGWHAGKTIGNDTLIGMEICEPKDYSDAVFFKNAWDNAVKLVAFLCKEFNLTEKDVISHKEGYKQGVASNHGDPDHWWSYHKKTMDDFRADVKDALKPKDEVAPWAKEGMEWAVTHKISDGTRPNDTCTRQEVIVMLKRMYDLGRSSK